MRLPGRLFLLLAAALPAAAEEAPPPAAIPVEDTAAAVVPDPGPQVVAPGGNIPQPRAEERAVSRSGMFRVSGGGPGWGTHRSAVALLLEQAKDDFEELMRERTEPVEKELGTGKFVTPEEKLDDFKIPVDVVLVDKEEEPSLSYHLSNTGTSFILGIRIHMARGLDHEQMERAALTVLLYERALREADPRDHEEVLVVRPWLVEGLIEAKKWRAGTADRRLYEGVFKQGGGFTLDELFEVSEKSLARLDGTSKLAFRALSGALVMALLEQPHGRGAFRSFCGEAARFSGEMPLLLRKHFPELNLSRKSLAKWWALTLAKLVQPKLTEVLSIRETEEGLDDALQFHTRDAEGNALNRGIDSWRAILSLEKGERVAAVKPAEERLVRLSYRCFPSYQSILREYQQILRDISAGEDDDLSTRIAELAEQRLVRMERALRARDYLNFIEISGARELSGEFADYMHLQKELEARPRAPRKDRVTRTLDTMERTYERRRER